MLEKHVAMKQSSTPSAESGNRPQSILFPFELEQLAAQLGHEPNDYEQLVYAVFRGICRYTFSTLNDTTFVTEHNSSTRSLPFELSPDLIPIARHHNLLFGELEMVETQIALKTSLSQLSSTYHAIPSPIVDGKIHFIKGEEHSQNNASF